MCFSGLFFYILLFLLDFFHIAPEGRAADAQLTGSGGAVAAVGGDGLLDSPIGLDGNPVFATLLVTGDVSPELLDACRSLPHPVRGDLTQLPGLLVARCLAGEALHARAWLIELWRLLRPALLGRAAVPPRIWST